MHNDIQTAANSKTHVGDAPVQISAAQIEKFVKAYKEARNELDWAMSIKATSEACAWWLGRKEALRHVLVELDIEVPEEL